MIDVAIIDDHPLYRDGVARAIDVGAGLRVAHVSGTPQALLGHLRRTPTQVVLVDLNLPGVSGTDLIGTVVGLGHLVLVVSASSQRSDVLDALAAGARGYLSKDVDAPTIVQAVRTVAAGDTYVSPTLAGHVLDDAGSSTGGLDRLTAREREVLALLAEGETDQQIADALSVGIRTVRSHLERVRDKTGRRRRAELTRLALGADPTRARPR